MANSSIVSEIKDKLIKEIINDENLFYAINSPYVSNPKEADDLINKHLFRYHQNPNTIQDTITFLTIQVHIAKANRYKANDLWSVPTVEIWIISHHSCMQVDNIPKITADRNDYISQLLDEKFNGRSVLGTSRDKNPLSLLGKLELVENSEGVFSSDYLYRKMVFVGRDLSDALCEV